MFNKGIAQYLPFLDQTSSSSSSGYEESSADSTSLGSLFRNRLILIEPQRELAAAPIEPQPLQPAP